MREIRGASALSSSQMQVFPDKIDEYVEYDR